MQSGPVLGPGSLISEGGRILELVFQDLFYAIYSAEAPHSGAAIGITEYFPADLVTRAPGGDLLLRSLEVQDLFDLGRDRFMIEVKALSALRHPSLLRFDGVVPDHGAAYALHAPEQGQSLTSLVKSPKPPPPQDEIDAIVNPLISALELLHSKDLTHTNITPDAILLRPAPLLIRFGAARSFLAARMRKVNLAVTPGYSAPELHFSDEKAHRPPCDVFSLAAVLYFVVTGRHPINVIARSLGHTMPPAAAIPSQRFRAGFLEAIDRGLELDPERRPPTIKAFGEMLFGGAQKKASAIPRPASTSAANLAEGSQGDAISPVPSPDGTPSTAAGAVSSRSAYAPASDTEGDEDDDFDDTRDFGSGVGLRRLLVAVAVLALVIPAGLWMLEPQFKNQPGQAARADAGKSAVSDSAPVDIAALQAQQTGNTERFETAKPDPAVPPVRTAAAQKPGAAVTGAEASLPQPASTPAAPAETAGEKAPSKAAIAEPVPLPGASVSSPAGLTFKDCNFCPSLVVAPKGEFTMGSNEHPHEKPAHKVKIPLPFAIGQYEVTIEEWDRCVEALACRRRPELTGSPTQPVGNLSWDDANAYLKWLSEKTGQIYRLPSEAEWEYAARAGASKRFWWGDEAGSGKANCSDCGSGTNGRAAPVGAYRPNPFGLYDTAGNMAEWVQDCWNDSYHGAPADGSAWVKGNCSLRGLRGGSFGNKSTYIRSSARFRYDSDVRYEANGFRVLRELR